MNRQAIGTLVGLLVGWFVYSSLDNPYVRGKAGMYALFAGIAAQRIVVWLLAITDDLGFSAPKSEPPAETWPELLRAAEEGNTERVHELLKAGADPRSEEVRQHQDCTASARRRSQRRLA